MIVDNKLDNTDEWKAIEKYAHFTSTYLLTNDETTEIIRALRTIKDKYALNGCNSFWDKIHPRINELCFKQFNDRHYAVAVETAFKELEMKVKAVFKESRGTDFAGKSFHR